LCGRGATLREKEKKRGWSRDEAYEEAAPLGLLWQLRNYDAYVANDVVDR
jgi:hypothetical protein